jgi:L-rhamnose mutarotase
MPRIAFRLWLKDDPAGIETYVDHHLNPFDGLYDLIRAAGIVRYTIWLDGTDLFQSQWITLDCGGRMGVANAGIFLQRGNPGHLHRRRLNPLMQRRHLLHLAKKPGRDCVNRLITHRLVKHKSSYWSSAPSCKLQAAVQEGPSFL